MKSSKNYATYLYKFRSMKIYQFRSFHQNIALVKLAMLLNSKEDLYKAQNMFKETVCQKKYKSNLIYFEKHVKRIEYSKYFHILYHVYR